MLLATSGGAGCGLIVTTICALSLSQPLAVWLTYQLKVPATLVDGVGVVADPVPPVGVVYHKRLVPTATSGLAISNWQYVALVGTGSCGLGYTIAFIGTRGLSHVLRFWLTKYVNVVAEEVETVGAVVLPVPPVAAVYQSTLLPLTIVLISGVAGRNWQ